MLGSYVCRQCSSRIARRSLLPRVPQWQQRATFISLRTANAEPVDTPAPGPASAEPPARATPPPPPSPPPVREEAPRYEQVPSFSTRPSRYAKHLQYPAVEVESPVAQPAVPPTPQPRAAPAPRTPLLRAEPETAPSDEVAQAIRPREPTSQAHVSHLLRGRQFEAAFTAFCEAYPSQDAVPKEPSSLYGAILDSSMKSFRNNTCGTATPTEVLFKFHQLDLFRFDHAPSANGQPVVTTIRSIRDAFRDTIRDLTDQLLLSIGGEKGRQRPTEEILKELLSVWRVLFQCRGPGRVELESIDSQWKMLPDPSTLNPAFMETDSFVTRLQNYHPKLMSHPTMAFSATVIFGFLNARSRYPIHVSEELRAEAAPFLTFLTHLLSNANVRLVVSNMSWLRVFKLLPADFKASVAEIVSRAPGDAKALLGQGQGSASKTAVDSPPDTPEQYLLKRIARSVREQSHTGRLESLWREALRTYTNDNGKPEIPLTVYNEFLEGYSSLQAGDRTVQVWNHMVGHGVKPDVRTWTGMLTGCTKGRDINALKTMWDRMIRSGIQPDNHAWTARVNGLISLGQINDGFTALDAMAKQWLAEEKELKKKTRKPGAPAPVNPFPKPSVEAVNAALGGIAQLRRTTFEKKKEFMRRVLQWANSLQLRPDARTYNILIQLHARWGDNATTLKLLSQMEADGIPHDIATYTTLITASFESEAFSHLSPPEQTKSLMALFSQLEAGGLTLNSYVYSISIDRMLKQYVNYGAARTIVDHMLSRGWMPNPHIYTSLVTHYFQQTPPDIDAVDSLWFRIMHTPGVATDRVMFDRVIEGYASVREVGKMMAVLATMSKHGKLPGWVALTAVVRALADAGDWDRARQVVRDVQHGEGVAKGGIIGNRHGSEDFVKLITTLGVIPEEGDMGPGDGWVEKVHRSETSETSETSEASEGSEGSEGVETREGRESVQLHDLGYFG